MDATRKRPWRPLIVLAAVVLIVLVAHRLAGPVLATELEGKPAPEFTHRSADTWINSAPLSIADLKGKVVLMDFWTFDCWNCYRSFPWLHSVETKFSHLDFAVVGIHSPEFEHEKVRDNVVEKVTHFQITHPVMMDNDFSYWRAMQNRYWPTFYLVDKKGRVRARFIGETHEGDARARAIEEMIRVLLSEEA